METVSGSAISVGIDLSGLEANTASLITQGQQIIEQNQQIIEQNDKIVYALGIIICLLFAAALVFAYKAFSRFLNQFF